MRWSWAAGAFVAAGAALWAATRERGAPHADPPPPVTTPFGEVLPPFAKVRLGPPPPPANWGEIRVLPGGRHALVGRGEWDVARIDLATREPVGRVQVEPWRAAHAAVRKVGVLGRRTLDERFDPPVPADALVAADGRRVVVAVGAQVRVLDAATGSVVATLEPAGAFHVNSVAIAADGSRVAAACSARGGPAGATWIASWWDVAAPARERVVASGQITGVALSDDGAALAALGPELTVFDLPAGSVRFRTERDPKFSPRAVAWSPDGRRVAHARGEDGDVVVRDAADGRELWRTRRGYVGSLRFSPDGRRLVLPGAVTWVRDAETGAVVADLPRACRSADFTPDGARLVLAADTVRVFDTTTWTEIDAPPPAPELPSAELLAWAGDGTWIATASGTGHVRTWDTATGALRASARPVDARIRDLAVAPDGGTVAILDKDGVLVVLDGATLAERSRSPGPATSSIAFRDGVLLRLDRDADGSLVETVVGTGVETGVGTAARRIVGNVGTAPWACGELADDVPYLLARGQGGNVVHDLRNGTPIPADPGLSQNSVGFAADGSSCVVSFVGSARGGIQEGLQVRMLPGGERVTEIGAELRDTLAPFAISRGGTLVAWSGVSPEVELWHVPTTARAARLVGSRTAVVRLGFSPDGDTLAAATRDGSVVLWDVSGWRR